MSERQPPGGSRLHNPERQRRTARRSWQKLIPQVTERTGASLPASPLAPLPHQSPRRGHTPPPPLAPVPPPRGHLPNVLREGRPWSPPAQRGRLRVAPRGRMRGRPPTAPPHRERQRRRKQRRRRHRRERRCQQRCCRCHGRQGRGRAWKESLLACLGGGCGRGESGGDATTEKAVGGCGELVLARHLPPP